MRLAVGTVDADVDEHVEISQADRSRFPKLSERGFGHRDQSASKSIDGPTSVFHAIRCLFFFLDVATLRQVRVYRLMRDEILFQCLNVDPVTFQCVSYTRSVPTANAVVGQKVVDVVDAATELLMISIGEDNAEYLFVEVLCQLSEAIGIRIIASPACFQLVSHLRERILIDDFSDFVPRPTVRVRRRGHYSSRSPGATKKYLVTGGRGRESQIRLGLAHESPVPMVWLQMLGSGSSAIH